MASKLTAGQNIPLEGEAPYRVLVTHASGPEVDLTAFVLGEDGRVRSDNDMVFYNQPRSRGVEWQQRRNDGRHTTHEIVIDPRQWSADVASVRIALTVDNATFGSVADLEAVVVDTHGTQLAHFDLSSRNTENAFIVGEVYRRNGTNKVRCVAAGYDNGLAGLGRDAGVNIADESPAPVAPQSSINWVKQLADAPLPANASKVDLSKKQLAVVLVKNKLDGRIFRVVLLIDASGSMYALYAKRSAGGSGWLGRGGEELPSVVQASLERMVPIADLLDDNHEMEVWFFGTRPSRAATVTIDTMVGYVDANWQAKQAAGGSNDETLAMQAVLDWIDENPSPYPTLVLAWSDGGVCGAKRIESLLRKASNRPLFWMWLGLGRSNYGTLAKFDQLSGMTLDNCGFIEIDNIENMSDADLYDKIFAHVKKWYDAAVAAGIVSA